MSALQLVQSKTATIINRPCVRCELDLTDPVSVEAGIGPICRGKANQILAKEVPSSWSDTDLFNFMFLTADSFPTEDKERFTKVFGKICKSKGMNEGQGQAVKGDDMRDVARELVYLASVAPTNAIYETLIGAIRGIGYVKYAAYVSGDSASGEATVTLEGDNVFLSAVRNSVGHNALYKAGARKEYRGSRFFISKDKALDFIPIVAIYWPFAKGIDEVLTALSPAPTVAQEEPTAPAPQAEATTEEAPAKPTEEAQEVAPETATETPTIPEEVPAVQAPAETPTEPAQEAQEAIPSEVPVPTAQTNNDEISIDHGEFVTHHIILKRTEKALQIENDCPFSRQVNSWIPKSWLKETPIKGTFRIIPWAFDKLTKYQEAALGIRAL